MRQTLYFLAVAHIVLTPLAAVPIRLFERADHSAQARYAAVQGAESEILQMVYVFQNDGAAFANAAMLREKARAGVKVRLLIDSFSAGHRVSNAILKHLANSGVEVKLYNPFRLRAPLQYLLRMHDKLLLVDGKVFITGGRNTGNHYYGFKDPPWRDLDLQVESAEIGGTARAYFQQIWDSARSIIPDWKKVKSSDVVHGEAILDTALKEVAHNPILHPPDGKDWKTTEVHEGDARFMSFDFDPKKGRANDPRQLKALLRSAQRRIEIVTPYFAPPTELENILKDRVADRVRVTIVTNSEASNNQKFVAAYYQANLKRYAEMGFEIVEMDGVTTHTKAMVVDDTALVGTFNSDAISWYKNLEIGVLIPSKEIAGKLHYLIERSYKKFGTAVARNGRLLPGASPCRAAMRWLTRPLRNHL